MWKAIGLPQALGNEIINRMTRTVKVKKGFGLKVWRRGEEGDQVDVFNKVN